MSGVPAVRLRLDFAPQCSVGIGKIQLLEGIARCGSLSQAARDMRMSYRRAWLLLEDLNRGFDLPVAKASVGGRGGGGVRLTPFGTRLVDAYRVLEADLKPLVERRLKGVGRRAVARAAPLRSARGR